MVNFNRFPELLTAICRRIGAAIIWHFFDDQGTLDFKAEEAEGTQPEERAHASVLDPIHRAGPCPRADIPDSGMSAQCFVSSVFDLIGRPFKAKKHLPPMQRQTHLGLLNDFFHFESGLVCLRPKEGKLDDIYEKLVSLQTRQPRQATLAEVMHIAGILIFFLMACFDKIARGGLRPFFDWISEFADARTLWRTKHHEFPITPKLLGGRFVCESHPSDQAKNL